jgi:hypothetical protein
VTVNQDEKRSLEIVTVGRSGQSSDKPRLRDQRHRLTVAVSGSGITTVFALGASLFCTSAGFKRGSLLNSFRFSAASRDCDGSRFMSGIDFGTNTLTPYTFIVVHEALNGPASGEATFRPDSRSGPIPT